jgi:AcrR family transcriptional regulator
MQVLDERKREKILEAAAALFAAQPYHKVLLSEVAESASVGKGTLYIYFKDKEDLYLSVVQSGIGRLLAHLRERLENGSDPARETLAAVIRQFVAFAFQNPHLFEMLRTVPGWELTVRTRLEQTRRELRESLAALIRRGIAAGEMRDPNPELTAKIIPGLVRALVLDGTDGYDQESLTCYLLRFVDSALAPRPREG